MVGADTLTDTVLVEGGTSTATRTVMIEDVHRAMEVL